MAHVVIGVTIGEDEVVQRAVTAAIQVQELRDPAAVEGRRAGIRNDGHHAPDGDRG